MTRQSFSLRFFLKNPKDVLSKVYVRIIVNRRKVEIGTSITVKTIDWDDKAQRPNRQKAAAEELLFLENQFVTWKREWEMLGTPYTARDFKNKYLGQGNGSQELLAYFKEHADQIRVQREDYSWGTVKNYYTTHRHLQAYLTKIQNTHMYIQQVNYAFLKRFDAFLLTIPNVKGTLMSRNTANKHHQRLNTVLNQAYPGGGHRIQPLCEVQNQEHQDAPHLSQQGRGGPPTRLGLPKRIGAGHRFGYFPLLGLHRPPLYRCPMPASRTYLPRSGGPLVAKAHTAENGRSGGAAHFLSGPKNHREI